MSSRASSWEGLDLTERGIETTPTPQFSVAWRPVGGLGGVCGVPAAYSYAPMEGGEGRTSPVMS